MDKFLTVSGRPSNITASANVTLGASDMSPDQVRSILKGGVKQMKKQPTKASQVTEHRYTNLLHIMRS